MNIDDEINRLQARLKELERQKEELNQPLTITLKARPAYIDVEVKLSKFRPDVVDYLRYVPGRRYDSVNQVNYIPYTKIFEVEEHLLTLDNLDIVWNGNDKLLVENYVNQPDLKVSFDDKKRNIIVTLGPNLNHTLWMGNVIPSWTRVIGGVGNRYRMSISELHLFPTAIKDIYGSVNWKIEYDEDVIKTLAEQVDRINLLAQVANATDWPEIKSPFVDDLDLKPHQRVGVKFAELVGLRALEAYDMGLGKTAIAIALAERNNLRVLIVCPANLKTMWARTIYRFTKKEANVLSGIEPDALALNTLFKTPYQYNIINWDVIGREVGEGENKLMKWVEVLNFCNFDAIFYDEMHYAKNMESKRSRGARHLKAKNIVELTGTPLVNRPGELYPALHILNPEEFNDYSTFVNNYTDAKGYSKNTKALHAILARYMIRRTRKDVFGENLEPTRIPFEKVLSPRARAAYERVLQGIYESLRDPTKQYNVTSILAELVRCKQICSSDNCETTAELAQDALNDTQKKVIIFSQFKESQYTIKQLLGNECVVINGEVDDETRYDLIDKFQDMESGINYIVTNILEGITLTAAHTVIFNDLWWTPKDHNQAEGRAFGRVNDPHSGNAYYVQNINTIDEMIIQLLHKKMAIFKEVIDGVEHTGANESLVGELIKMLRG